MHLHYKTYGSGHPLIILHALFGSLNNWQTMSKKFGERFRVFAVDQRNHGGSPHSNVHNYQALAEDLHGFMHEHGISSSHLLGHSMGGKTAMQFALRFPEKTDSLIVVDMVPKTYRGGHDDIIDALSAINLSRFSSRKEINDALSGSIPDVSVREFLLTNVTRDKSGRFTWKMNLNSIRKNYSEISKGVETHGVFEKPTLFIAGGKSGYIKDEDKNLLKRMFPRSRITTIDAAGHWVHAEAPEEFARVVLDFLQLQ